MDLASFPLISSIFQGKHEVKSWAESEGGGEVLEV